MAERNCTCAHCGVEFVTQYKDKIYCSRKCKVVAWRTKNPEQMAVLRAKENKKKSCAVKSGYCLACGSPYSKKQTHQYCSDECKSSSRAIRNRIKAREKYAEDHGKTRICKKCGTEFSPKFTGGRKSIYCSNKCASESYEEAIKRGSKIHKAKRRAKQKDPLAERVDPFVVFDRDKWTCQICRVKTPKSKRGTYADNAPELDHIVPLSKGGKHTYKNTQCACRKCNGLKSDKPLGQLLLIG